MHCQICGKEFNHLEINNFRWDGTDGWDRYYLDRDYDDDEIVELELSRLWTGYELSEEEQFESIKCPYCFEYPFKYKEIHVHNVLRVVMFPK